MSSKFSANTSLVLLALASAACGPPDRAVGSSPLTPEPPPFPDLCSRYRIEYSGGGCDQPCPRVDQACFPNWNPEYLSCSTEKGCVASYDIAPRCADLVQGRTFPSLDDCIGNCHDDDDCGGMPCITLPAASGGRCSFDGVCLDDGDCRSGDRCVAIRADGLRKCSAGRVDASDPCNSAKDCAAGGHCALPDSAFLGRCSDGAIGSFCYRDTDCARGRRCVEAKDVSFPEERKLGRCTDGSDGAPCAADTDCAQGKCSTYRCGDSSD
jgi:hypothetical protein